MSLSCLVARVSKLPQKPAYLTCLPHRAGTFRWEFEGNLKHIWWTWHVRKYESGSSTCHCHYCIIFSSRLDLCFVSNMRSFGFICECMFDTSQPDSSTLLYDTYLQNPNGSERNVMQRRTEKSTSQVSWRAFQSISAIAMLYFAQLYGGCRRHDVKCHCFLRWENLLSMNLPHELFCPAENAKFLIFRKYLYSQNLSSWYIICEIYCSMLHLSH